VSLESDLKYRDDHANLKWKKEPSLVSGWADAECLDDEPSYLLEPIYSPDDPSHTHALQPSVAEARLLGYYLAEGHILKNKKGEFCGIELTTNVDDIIHSEIEGLCESFGTKNKPHTIGRANSDASLSISIFDARLAEFCTRHAGRYPKSKKLSREVLGWRPELQLELLGAYANGDGTGPVDGSLKLSTSSVDLANQWLLILPRLGILPSLGELSHKAGSGKSNTNTIEYVVHIGKQWAQRLHKVCGKIQKVEILKSKNSRMIIGGRMIATPIREYDSIYVETDVFNLEVEEDNSYLVEGMAVHNCRVPEDYCYICGHASKTRDDYCIHMRPPPELREKYGPNKVIPDGRVCCVINKKPRFFDISFVFIGAEKTAKTMAKLASRGDQLCFGDVCSRPMLSAEVYDLAEKRSSMSEPVHLEKAASCGSSCGIEPAGDVMEKLAAGFRIKTSQEEKLSEILKRVPGRFVRKLSSLRRTEPDLPGPLVTAFSRRFPLRDVLGGFGRLGIVLKPHEFQRAALTRMGEESFADRLDEDRSVFRQVPEIDSSTPCCGGEGVAPLLADMLGKMDPGMIPGRTALGRNFRIRITSITIEPKNGLPTRNEVMEPLLDKVSAAYNGYRQNYLAGFSKVAELVESDPQLRDAVLGDRSLEFFSKQADDLPTVSLDSLRYVAGAHFTDPRLFAR